MDLTLPYVSLQPDYQQVYTDVSQSLRSLEKVWLSVYCLNAPNASIHTKLLLAAKGKGEVEVELDELGTNQLQIQTAPESQQDLMISSLLTSTTNHHVRNIGSHISLPPVILRVPKRTIGPVVKGALGVTAFDISPDNASRYVAGGGDGQAHIGMLGKNSSEDESMEQEEGSMEVQDIEQIAQERMKRREEREQRSRTYLKGHVGDVRSVRFFPSGQVVLTTSSDCTARIFGLDGSNPRVLTGHRRGVTSSSMIDRGKEVLTSSSDGSIKLWDVSEGVAKRTIFSHKFSSVNIISMGRARSNIDEGSSTTFDGTSKLLLSGSSNGYIEGHDVATGSNAFRLPPILFPIGEGPSASDRWEQVSSGSVEALDWSSSTSLLVAGCSNGVTLAHDIRMISSNEEEKPSRSLIASWRRNGAAVNDVRLEGNMMEAVISTADGTPYRIDLSQSLRVIEEYTGWDVDNVQASGIDSKGRAWLAGADGLLRMY